MTLIRNRDVQQMYLDIIDWVMPSFLGPPHNGSFRVLIRFTLASFADSACRFFDLLGGLGGISDLSENVGDCDSGPLVCDTGLADIHS